MNQFASIDTSQPREVMTLAEAADFLRFSRSTMYQRKDIPRHRMPGSREVRFIRSELLAWIKGGSVIGSSVGQDSSAESAMAAVSSAVDVPNGRVYHRNPRYR